MVNKIVEAVKAVFAPAKKPKSSIEYRDQPPWTIRHSSLDVERAQQYDGWINGYGRYRTNEWSNKR